MVPGDGQRKPREGGPGGTVDEEGAAGVGRWPSKTVRVHAKREADGLPGPRVRPSQERGPNSFGPPNGFGSTGPGQAEAVADPRTVSRSFRSMMAIDSEIDDLLRSSFLARSVRVMPLGTAK
jgi:hypothetical protein